MKVDCLIELILEKKVLMKDIVTPVPPEEVRNVIKKCLENAALVNYTRISEYAKIEGKQVDHFKLNLLGPHHCICLEPSFISFVFINEK